MRQKHLYSLFFAVFFSACVNEGTIKKNSDSDVDLSLFKHQWYLQNTAQSAGAQNAGSAGEDINVVDVWEEYQGRGVKVAVVDTGIELGHYDLKDNIDTTLSYRYSDKSNDPSPDEEQLKESQINSSHGTSCAGIIAAVGDNNLGIKGVAPKATLVGLNAFSKSTIENFADALYNKNRPIDVSSNSWNDWIASIQDDDLEIIAIKNGVTLGRDNKGIVYVFAAGNDREDYYNSNWNRELNNPFVITVASLDANGKYSSYSNFGANILISGYGGEFGDVDPAIVTTDLLGDNGADSLNPNTREYQTHFETDGNEYADFTNTMNGTSAAAPMIAGVVALILEANPSLTYRDVKYILATTARKNDPNEMDWKQNGAGYEINHNYGFGAVDTKKAVEKAKNFNSLKESIVVEKTVQGGIISDGELLEFSVQVGENIAVEFVEVMLELIHTDPSKLEIVLTSPSETNSTLSHSYYKYLLETETFNGFTFGSVRYLDENSNGTWKLTIKDKDWLNESSYGTLSSFILKIYGRER